MGQGEKVGAFVDEGEARGGGWWWRDDGVLGGVDVVDGDAGVLELLVVLFVEVPRAGEACVVLEFLCVEFAGHGLDLVGVLSFEAQCAGEGGGEDEPGEGS